MGKKDEGIKKYKVVATEQPQGCKVEDKEHSQQHWITMYGARWGREISGVSQCKVYDCLPISYQVLYTPETSNKIRPSVNCD